MSDPEQPLLIDGSRPASPERLFRRLEELGIEFRTVRHPPVYTVEEAKRLRGDLPGGHVKNLFLRNKKRRMWLVVCPEDRAIDLRALGGCMEAGNLSFGSPKRLMQYLGVIPGAVTPFAVLNDQTGAVKVVVDRAVLAVEPLHFHPLDNAMTTAISAADFLRFLEAEEHPAQLIDLAEGQGFSP